MADFWIVSIETLMSSILRCAESLVGIVPSAPTTTGTTLHLTPHNLLSSLHSSLYFLYVERSKGARGLLSVKDVVEKEEKQLKKYTERSLEDMMGIVRQRISFRGDRAEKKDMKHGQKKSCMASLKDRQKR